MTTLHDGSAESLQHAVARRLRGLLAEQRISQRDFADHTGWGRAYLYRRLQFTPNPPTNGSRSRLGWTGSGQQVCRADPHRQAGQLGR